MLSQAALDRHLKAAHADFGAADLFTDAGGRVTGFFITRAALGNPNEVPEGERYFRSPDRYELGTRITDRKAARAWRVKNREGEDGAWIHTLEATPAAA